MTARPVLGGAHLHLDSVPNARDLGGCLTEDGCSSVRTGRVFRAGSLRNLSSADAVFLGARLGLRAYFDLRTEEEVHPDDGGYKLGGGGIRWVRVPMSGLSPAFMAVTVPQWEDYASNYLYSLKAAGPPLRHLFTALSEARDWPVAFGCTLGKDRTGIAAALLLKALRVSDEQVAADYAASTCCLVQHSSQLEWLARAKGVTSEEMTRRLTTLPQTILRFLADLRTEHGGVFTYLAEIGVNATVLEALRERLLEEPPAAQ